MEKEAAHPLLLPPFLLCDLTPDLQPQHPAPLRRHLRSDPNPLHTRPHLRPPAISNSGRPPCTVNPTRAPIHQMPSSPSPWLLPLRSPCGRLYIRPPPSRTQPPPEFDPLFNRARPPTSMVAPSSARAAAALLPLVSTLAHNPDAMAPSRQNFTPEISNLRPQPPPLLLPTPAARPLSHSHPILFPIRSPSTSSSTTADPFPEFIPDPINYAHLVLRGWPCPS